MLFVNMRLFRIGYGIQQEIGHSAGANVYGGFLSADDRFLSLGAIAVFFRSFTSRILTNWLSGLLYSQSRSMQY